NGCNPRGTPRCTSRPLCSYRRSRTSCPTGYITVNSGRDSDNLSGGRRRSAHHVVTDHPAHHVVDHVAVIQPPTGIVLGPIERQRGRRAQQLRVPVGAIGHAPAMAVYVEHVELRPERGDPPPNPLPVAG